MPKVRKAECSTMFSDKQQHFFLQGLEGAGLMVKGMLASLTETWSRVWRTMQKAGAPSLAAQNLELEARVQILGLLPGDCPTLGK